MRHSAMDVFMRMFQVAGPLVEMELRKLGETLISMKRELAEKYSIQL